MKWNKVGLITALLLVLCAQGTSAAVDAGVATFTVRTNTQVLAQITTAPSEVDSVFVCYIASGASDTVFAAQIDSVTTAKILTGLSPNSTASWFILVRGNGGDTDYTTETALTTYGPEIETNVNTTALYDVEKIITATSWRPATIVDSLVVNGSSGIDSTAVYRQWPHNSVTVYAAQAGDSVKAMLYTFYGHREMTQTGATTGYTTSQDSLNITGIGVHGKTLTLNNSAPAMYFTIQGYGGNGKNAYFKIWLTRDRY